MTEKETLILKETQDWVHEKLAGETSGHDWWHIVRVCHSAESIATEEGANTFICIMAALLHDMADEKLNEDPKKADLEVKEWLYAKDLTQEQADHILDITRTISFKGGHGKALTDLEAKIVQDADRLDAIGAIGIARCMAYSGHKGRLIYDPNMTPRENMTQEEYRNGQDTAIMHFYEKLLTLKDRMNTTFGKKLAQQRHEFLLTYLEQFYEEWDGKR